MAAKIVFLLALVALALGLPASERNVEPSSDTAIANKVPPNVSEYLESLYKETLPELVSENEPTEIDNAARRVRRYPVVCRRVIVHAKNGLNYPRVECH